MRTSRKGWPVASEYARTAASRPPSNGAIAIHHLPVEIFEFLLELLADVNGPPGGVDYGSLYSCSLVSKLWHQISTPLLWRKLFFNDEAQVNAILKSPALGRYLTEALDMGPDFDIDLTMKFMRELKGIRRLVLDGFGNGLGEEWLAIPSLSGLKELCLMETFLPPFTSTYLPTFEKSLTKIEIDTIHFLRLWWRDDPNPSGPATLFFPTPALQTLAINAFEDSPEVHSLLRSALPNLEQFCSESIPPTASSLFVLAKRLQSLSFEYDGEHPFLAIHSLPTSSLRKLDISFTYLFKHDTQEDFVTLVDAVQEVLKSVQLSELEWLTMRMYKKHVHEIALLGGWKLFNEELKRSRIKFEFELWK